MALRPNERPGLKLSCLCPREGLFTLTGKQRERRRQWTSGTTSLNNAKASAAVLF